MVQTYSVYILLLIKSINNIIYYPFPRKTKEKKTVAQSYSQTIQSNYKLRNPIVVFRN